LQMVEKVGHSKRMQVMRRAWMDGTKPSQRQGSVERVGDAEMSGALGDLAEGGREQGGVGKGDEHGDADLFGEVPEEGQQARGGREEDGDDMPEDDELDALMRESGSNTLLDAPPQQKKQKGPFEEDDDEEDADPDDDDLDALLAEEGVETTQRSSKVNVSAQDNRWGGRHQDDFADEEEVMAGMDGMW